MKIGFSISDLIEVRDENKGNTNATENVNDVMEIFSIISFGLLSSQVISNYP